METLAIVVAVIAIILSCYTNGNIQANNLMEKIGGIFETVKFWSEYPVILGMLIFWILPCVLTTFVFGWWGLLYLPIVFLLSAKFSIIFLKKQLQKRLLYAQQTLNETVKKSKNNKSRDSEIQVGIKQHRVNELKWLISHPGCAQQIALSDDNNINPQISAAFEFQVKALDNISKQDRLTSKK